MRGLNKRSFKIVLTLLLGVMFGCFNMAYAIEDLDLREMDSNFLDIEENIMNSQNDIIYSSEDAHRKSQQYQENNNIKNAPILVGGISELRAIVGKSQIIRFDEPVTRISITKPELVDMVFLNPKEVIVNGKTGGETTVIVWGEGKEPVFFNLFVENNNINFIKEVRKVAPNEDLEIDFIDTGNDSALKVVLKGKLSSSILKNRIKELASAYGYTLVDLTETLEPQVLLEVKIIEMGKTKGKGRGYEFKKGIYEYVDFAEELSRTDWYVESLDLKGNVVKLGVGETDDDLIANVLEGIKEDLAGTSFTDGSLNTWKVFPDKNLSLHLNAAESEGIIKILSEPKVMAINGSTANFQSGGSVAVPNGADELGNIKYEYKKIGTTIDITPTILEETERILLKITADVTEINNSLSSDLAPGFNTRHSQTEVEIANNHTTVITGLVRKSQTKTITKFPFLSNLPVVGKLFDTVTSSTDDTELMIFVTASIVKPGLARGE